MNGSFAHDAFAPTRDVMRDETPARRGGCPGFIDSQALFVRIFDSFRRRRPIS